MCGVCEWVWRACGLHDSLLRLQANASYGHSQRRACAADHGWAAATARRRTTFELDTLARGQLPHLVGVEVMVGIRVGLGLKLGSGLGSRLG